MAAARPVISVYDSSNAQSSSTLPLPTVFQAPIRLDIVRFVHDNLAKNARQPYAVNSQAGMNYSAESWGTGRAVSRIPRISGSGTGRAAQGAFGNMCRGGRMFNPTKIWRRWHRRVNLKQKRHAVASAIAASAVSSLVMARGHKIDDVPEIPLVVSGIEKVERAKDMLELLKRFGCKSDLNRVEKSRTQRAGRGKSRGRKYKLKRGPLIVYEEKNAPVVKAARNLLGVETCNVHKLNILQLAPGGTMGRFVIWSDAAFQALDGIFGTYNEKGQEKGGYQLQRPMMAQQDSRALIQSDSIQSVLRPMRDSEVSYGKKKNPFKNPQLMEKLNPFFKAKRRYDLLKVKNAKGQW